VIITTQPYDVESVKEILRIRSEEEKIELDSKALEKLAEVGAKSSLRYAVQLLSLAAQNAKALNKKKVAIEDVQRVDELFKDISEAAEYLRKYEEKLMIH
jgi:DNA helicase TIP49 (TBP-interacting protein)